jgi:hypothetical protein
MPWQAWVVIGIIVAVLAVLVGIAVTSNGDYE